MEARLSRFGVGPRTLVPSVLYMAGAWLATKRWRAVFRLELPDWVASIGLVLIGLGVVLWLTGIVTVMRAYDRDRLVTTGVFALVRHPAYSGWITLIFPGLALLARSWLMLLTPLIAYAIFKQLIGVEDMYLAKRYGQAYLDYRQRANELLPIPRFRR